MKKVDVSSYLEFSKILANAIICISLRDKQMEDSPPICRHILFSYN